MLAFLRLHGQRLRLFLHSYGRSLLALFFGLLFPLLAFVAIAAEVYEQDPFSFERPFMFAVHAQAAPPLDRLAASLAAFGNTPGMLPVTLILAACLYRMRPRLTYFLMLSLAGSVVFHAVLKKVFDRPRPTLWTPIAPEADFSFPSGHAMFAASLVSALVVLLWPTRWRWAALVLGVGYVLTMMWSRVYSGVHYPTDVLAGALVGLIWVMALDRLLQGHRLLASPPQSESR
ncbi:phosphatase PAP2 family protein [Deinococcus sp. QL22]|uniref:phosphatase PAP2 family protein n=1 Tax=Deinococcus sp. QL22 TaxID=2939437 RepID=UPI002017489D|nr:phosphatase PAP2 family protein [Deinococcus sp. QL22]UQN09612.1 phosphatase PAP2 family protein [Deinococcus sp. QL22]